MNPCTLFLSGDVMTGRGIDQILPHPGDPTLREPEIRDAREYVSLAERTSGAIPAPVSPDYPWGEALDALRTARPDTRIVNLETAVTTSDEACVGKEVLYRMHPANVGCLQTGGVDVAVLANNHTLDWGRAGLVETLDTLDHAGIRCVGAGRTEADAWRPIVHAWGPAGRVVIVAAGSPSAGVPPDWRAERTRPGIALIDDITPAWADRLTAALDAVRRVGDVGVVSLHWGSNWGFGVTAAQRRFARRLIDGGCHVVHGHSSHHVRPIEVYRGRLIFYGCGDLIDDYEGIHGFEQFRADLGLLYLPAVDAHDGRLVSLAMVPTRMRRMRLERADALDAAWLAETLTRINAGFDSRVTPTPDGGLRLVW